MNTKAKKVMNKILIAYFSLAGETYVNGRVVNRQVGNTEVIARKLQKKVGGDLFHIETVEPYPEDYYRVTEVAKKELHEDARPKLSGTINDFGQYDTIVLGYPNWWGTMPMAVKTFLETFNLGGNTIIPFCTHEGSGMGHSERDLQELCPGAKILNGTAIHGADVETADHEVAKIIELIKTK